AVCVVAAIVVFLAAAIVAETKLLLRLGHGVPFDPQQPAGVIAHSLAAAPVGFAFPPLVENRRRRRRRQRGSNVAGTATTLVITDENAILASGTPRRVSAQRGASGDGKKAPSLCLAAAGADNGRSVIPPRMIAFPWALFV
ncbi:unnamed protein product, partial [Ectocarpus sp. 12 AP-2014]